MPGPTVISICSSCSITSTRLTAPARWAVRFAVTAPASIDMFVTDVDEFERRKGVNGSMLYWPAHEGEVVYERAIA